MSEPEPRFARVSGTDLYWLPASGRTIGFQATPGADLGDEPTLTATWGDAQGAYLFLGAEAVQESFATGVVSYLRSIGWPSRQRFLWLANPNAPVADWAADVLEAIDVDGRFEVAGRTDFAFKSYILSVSGGGSVALGTAEQDWGFAFAAAGGLPVATLFAPAGSYAARAGELRLPLTGPVPGCWRFAIELPDGTSEETDFARLAVGIRYFYPEPAPEPEPEPASPPPAGSNGGVRGDVFVRALELPAILQPAEVLALHAALDPVRHLDGARTHLSFFGPGGGPGGSFASTFATADGHGVELTPLAAAAGTPDARLVFAEQPLFVGADGYVPTDYYLTLDGAFAVDWVDAAPRADAAGTDRHRMLCGTSGLEYVGVPAAAASRLVFVPGGAAYSSLEPPAKADAPALERTGTTAWVRAEAEADVRYYAQPEEAPMYEAPGAQAASATIGTEFLDFLEVPAVELPPQASFPLAPYRGLAAEAVDGARAMEAAAIAPARRRALTEATAGIARAGGPAGAATAKVGVTPQGLGVGVGADDFDWTWLGVANDNVDTADRPSLRFTTIDGPFKQAMQTNRLFMVMANAEVLSPHGSVAYRLTAEGIAEIEASGKVPPLVFGPVREYLKSRGWPTYETEAEFVTALLEATPAARDYELDFKRHAGLLAPRIGDWRFQMSPYNWHNPEREARKDVIVVFKLARGRSLRELTDDLTSWTWPAVAAIPGGTAANTQKELQRIYDDAVAAYERTSEGGRDSPYANIVRLLDDPDWSGIVAFGCDVPLGTLPEPLQALAAGIDPRRFYAHHVGFDVTPFGASPGSLEFGRTAMFGLIDYDDPEDQHASEDVYFLFKVLRLTVGFRNSALTSFSSRVELLVNRMLGATTRLYPTDHGNNVVLDGVYQRHPAPDGTDHGTYVFSMVEQNTLQLESSALRKVVLRSTQLVTSQPARADDPDAKVAATFLMGGDMHFYEPAPFDAFSFGEPPAPPEEDQASQSSGLPARRPSASLGEEPPPPAPAESFLRFANLAVRMEFRVADRVPAFSLVTETLSFDLPNSKPRPASLFARFPLKIAGFLATPDPKLAAPATAAAPHDAAADEPKSKTGPETFGYVSVGAPIDQSAMTDPWYGIVYTVDLGSLGALAGSAGLSLTVLVAWSGAGERDAPPVYVGVRLPGVKDALGVELPLQGVITFGFRSMQFLVSGEGDERAYMLRLRNFALRLLGISFPPGNNDVYVFGNPDETSPTKLGWYAAYSAEDDPKKKQIARGPA